MCTHDQGWTETQMIQVGKMLAVMILLSRISLTSKLQRTKQGVKARAGSSLLEDIVQKQIELYTSLTSLDNETRSPQDNSVLGVYNVNRFLSEILEHRNINVKKIMQNIFWCNCVLFPILSNFHRNISPESFM